MRRNNYFYSEFPLTAFLTAIAVVMTIVLIFIYVMTAMSKNESSIAVSSVELEVLSAIDSNASVLDLSLYQVDVDSYLKKYNSRLGHVKKVILSGSSISDQGLSYLKTLYNLEDIILDDTQITREGLRHLASLPKLESLDCSNTNLKSMDWSHGFPQLSRLVLGNSKLGKSGLKGIQEIRKLKHLNIAYTEIAYSDLCEIAKLDMLEVLNLCKCQIAGPSLDCFYGNKSLERFLIAGSNLELSSGDNLCVIKSLQKLKMLYVSKNQVSEALLPLGKKQKTGPQIIFDRM